ncbi:hypothetical protein [Nocardia sp. NPDC004860]
MAAPVVAAAGADYLAPATPGAPAEQSASGIDNSAPVGGIVADESATRE